MDRLVSTDRGRQSGRSAARGGSVKRSPLKRTATLKRGGRLRTVSTRPRIQASLKKRCRYLVVELRDRNQCQLNLPHRCTGPLEWCHVKTRGAPSLVCEPWNSLALCRNAHQWFDDHKGNPLHPGVGFTWWAQMFPVRAEALRLWEHGHRSAAAQRDRIELAIQLIQQRCGQQLNGPPEIV